MCFLRSHRAETIELSRIPRGASPTHPALGCRPSEAPRLSQRRDRARQRTPSVRDIIGVHNQTVDLGFLPSEPKPSSVYSHSILTSNVFSSPGRAGHLSRAGKPTAIEARRVLRRARSGSMVEGWRATKDESMTRPGVLFHLRKEGHSMEQRPTVLVGPVADGPARSPARREMTEPPYEDLRTHQPRPKQ